MYGFASAKLQSFAAALNALFNLADQVHFDALPSLVVEGVMTKLRNIEVRVQQPIEVRENVEIEARGDASSVVVGCVQARRRLV